MGQSLLDPHGLGFRLKAAARFSLTDDLAAADVLAKDLVVRKANVNVRRWLPMR
jgi:hypothetical protein